MQNKEKIVASAMDETGIEHTSECYSHYKMVQELRLEEKDELCILRIGCPDSYGIGSAAIAIDAKECRHIANLLLVIAKALKAK